MMEETGRNERYLWLIELFKNGDIIPMKYLKSEKVNKEVKDERKEIIRMRFKKGIEREENLPYKEIYPMNKRLQIDLSKREGVGLIGIIKSIIKVINLKNIYMFDPTGDGSGYKYYRGEKVIIYQITKEMTINQIKKIDKQINKFYINGYDLEREIGVFKIVINTVKYEKLKKYKRYDMGKKGENLRVAFINAWNGVINSKRIEELTVDKYLEIKKSEEEN